MIEYNRQEPPDVQEYYQCEICHEEKHINELRPPDFTEKRIVCDDCEIKACSHIDAEPTSNGWKCPDCGKVLP